MMEDRYYRELEKISDSICAAGGISDEESDLLCGFVRDTYAYSYKILGEGLKAADEWRHSLHSDDHATAIFKKLLILISIKPDRSEITDTFWHYYLRHNDMTDVEKLLCLMIYSTVIMINEDIHPSDIMNNIESILPEALTEKADELIREYDDITKLEELEKNKKLLEKLCSDDGTEINPHDHSVINEFEIIADSLDEGSLRKLLQETEDNVLELALMGVRGRTIKKVTDQMPEGQVLDIISDIDKKEDVRDSDIKKACVAILRNYIDLREQGEIFISDAIGNSILPEDESVKAVLAGWDDADGGDISFFPL